MSGRSSDRPDAAERIAIGLTLLWALVCAVSFAVLSPGESGVAGSLMILLAVIMPVALIWIAALAARHIRLLRDENRHLRQAVADTQKVQPAPETAGNDKAQAQLTQRVEELSKAQKRTEAALARLNSVRPPAHNRAAELETSQTPAEDFEQPALALEPPAPEGDPLSTEDFILALNFPRDANDRDGFRALRRAMSDHTLAKLLRSAEDILTLLAEDGIYVDDLSPERAHPDIWRKFAAGKRGGVISDLGGVRDRESLANAAGRMRQDPVFRDCAHHFLRRFDTTLGRFAEDATDAELAAFSDTRSARAFMLLGRVSGMFD